jgi:hypothetical protein
MNKTTKSSRRLTSALMLLSVCGLPFLLGAEGGGGCGGTFGSKEPAPNVSGSWNITYGTTMDVDVKVGGSTYHQSMTSSGGTFSFMHAGTAFSFNIDCARPEVVCPSEVWPAQVTIDQRDAMYQHRMWVKIPTQTCNGQTVAPNQSECGAGTTNPDCKPICTGTVTTSSADAFGLIREGGTGFDLLLGGGFASNGINCALLGLSVASAELETVKFGSSWTANAMGNGQVKTGYAGGCLWAGPVDTQGKPSATVIGATVEIKTSFTGRKQ